MNRNEMYELLKESGLYGPLMVRREDKKYTKRFVLNRDEGQYECYIETDWGYISKVEAIHLYAKEVVIEGKLTDMTIHMNYKDIKEFEIIIMEE